MRVAYLRAVAGGSWSVGPVDLTIVLDERGRPKCEVYGDGKEEREAHTRLIAAAPELLEALIAYVGTPDEWADIQMTRRTSDARAAIAKATGGAGC
jgi:hypothetical protein